MKLNKKTIIVIVGPTAVGKTSLAVRIAERLQTQIISADSRQCYQELNIGVAKPSPSDLSRVHHYFIDSHSIHEDVNAASFEQYALASAETIFAHNDYAVMVGGTGLYIKSFLEGIDEIPAINKDVRSNIFEQYQLHGLSWLQDAIAMEDPDYYKDGELQNPARLIRALEVIRSTGNSIRHYQQQKPVERNFNFVMYGLELPKISLHENIEIRTQQMIDDGLVEEVAGLFRFKHLKALNTVGYKEIFNYLDGQCTLPEAIDNIKANTRKYAKRQLTWFRKQTNVWITPDDDEKILSSMGM